MKCENADRCEVKNCHHEHDHDKMSEPENNCDAPCDVRGGIRGSKCFGDNSQPVHQPGSASLAGYSHVRQRRKI